MAAVLPPPVIAYSGAVNNAFVARAVGRGGGVRLAVAGVDPFPSIGRGILAVTRRRGQLASDVVVYDAASRTLVRRIRDGSRPVVSASGRRVAFMPDRQGANIGDRDPAMNSVWQFDRRTRKVTLVARFREIGRAPLSVAFSPDGKRLAIAHGRAAIERPVYDIWIAPTDGGVPKRLTTDGLSSDPAFNATGDEIVFVHDTARGSLTNDLRAMRVNGTGTRVVATDPDGGSFAHPLFGPNGVLYALHLTGDGTVDLVSIDGSGALSTVTASVLSYSVSSRLGLIAVRHDNDSVSVIDVALGTEKTLPRSRALPGGGVSVG